MFNSENNWKNY